MSFWRTYSAISTTIGAITIVLLPAVFPMIAIPIGAIVWVITYFFLWGQGQSFDPSAQLPYISAFPPGDGWIPWAIVFIGVGAGIRGITGAIGMAVVWVPLFLLTNFTIDMGTSVYADTPLDYYKSKWEQSCYTDFGGKPDHEGNYAQICKFTPLYGQALPTFITDMYDKVLTVIPYPRSRSCTTTTITTKEGDKSTSTKCS